MSCANGFHEWTTWINVELLGQKNYWRRHCSWCSARQEVHSSLLTATIVPYSIEEWP